jgi:hypothetical protein
MFGGLNPVNIVSQVALTAATGGTSLFAQMAMQIASQVVKDVVSQVAQEFGIPQQFADDLGEIASAGFSGGAASAGELISNIAQQQGLSPSDTGALQGQADDLNSQLTQDITNHMLRKDKDSAGGAGGDAPSWLMAIAEALGAKLDQMADEMNSMADQISDKTPSLTAKFSAKTQQFSILMDATTNAIKTIGEALANTARKD